MVLDDVTQETRIHQREPHHPQHLDAHTVIRKKTKYTNHTQHKKRGQETIQTLGGTRLLELGAWEL